MSISGLKDIVIKDSDKGFFKEYLDKEEVCQKFLQGIVHRFQEGKGYALDDTSSNNIGIISNAMALSTLLELFDLSPESVKDYKDQFSELLSLLFDSIYKNNSVIFDASPYLYNDDHQKNIVENFIETISKILIVMIDMRDMLIRCTKFNSEISPVLDMDFNVRYKGKVIADNKKIIEIIESTIIICVQKLNLSVLPVEQPFDYFIGETKIERSGIPSKCEYRGWAFIDHEGKNPELFETSIYFTFHATNAYLSLYSSFVRLLSNDYDEETSDEYSQIKYDQDSRFFEENKNLLSDYKKRVVSSARYIDKILTERKIDLTSDFIDKNLNKVSYDELLKYQNSNAVINTLFIISIYINGSLDEDYDYINRTKDFYDKVQFAITNINRIYNALMKEKKEDLINTYKMFFNNKVPAQYEELVQQFRRKSQNIKVYDLIPLLTNTYSIVVEFLIKYPTREMINYLEMVMGQRNGDNKAWYWDKDGFNINNNLYYIFAIENFYDYYFKYENPLSEIGLKYNKDVLAAQKIAIKRKEELKLQQQKYKLLENQYLQKQSKLDNAVENVVKTILNENVNEHINFFISDMIDQNIKMCIDKDKMIQRGTTISNAELYDKYPKAKLLRKLSNAIYTGKIVKSISDGYIDESRIIDETNKKIINQFEDQEKIIENKGE